MTIATILERKGRDVVQVESGATVRDAVRLLAKHRIGALPVTKASTVIGIFSERDLIYCLEAEGAAALNRPVDELMTTPAITIPSEAPILAGLAEMSRRRIRHLPVIDENRLAGIVSIGDLVQHRLERMEQEADAMRAYIQGS